MDWTTTSADPTHSSGVLRDSTCRDWPQPSYCVRLESDLFVEDKSTGKSKKTQKELTRSITNIINALLNKGEGTLCIHSQNEHFLGNFQERIDDLLNAMIVDGSLYGDNFERSYDFSGTGTARFRVIYQIKHRDRQNIVMIDFKTKASLDKGLVGVTYLQLQSLLKREKPRSIEMFKGETPSKNAGRFLFVKNHEIERFVEDRWTQAKAIPEIHARDPKRLSDYMWNSVPNLISGFSKNAEGGSVYFGVQEEKSNPTLKWTQLKSPPEFLNIIDSNWKVWIDERGDLSYHVCKPSRAITKSSRSNPAWKEIRSGKVKGVVELTDRNWSLYEDQFDNVYHVATTDGVPVISERRTGRFVCAPACLDTQGRRFLKRSLLDKVSDELLWVGCEDPINPVTVHFHRVGRSDSCIIEVRVEYFHGIVFTDISGPESYRLNRAGEVVRINYETWLRCENTKLTRRMPWFDRHM